MSEKAQRWSSLGGGFLVSLLSLGLFALGRHASSRFGYSLDDPYIHLRVSEMIRSGHYGLEPGAASSPSSSIIWPFLLAPFASFDWHSAVPMVLNIVCVGATVPVLAATLRRCWADPSWQRWSTPAAVALALTGNLLATAATGMEHTAQTLAVAVMALGMVTAARGATLRWWFWVAVVAGPTIRYETLLVSGAALAVAWLSGERRRVLAATAAVGVALGAFSGFLLSLGLEPLPSSVLVKSDSGLANVTRHGTLVPVLFVTLLVAAVWLRHTDDRPNLVVVLAVAAVFAGHQVFASTEPVRYATSIRVLAFVVLAGALPSLLPASRQAGAAVLVALTLAVPAPSISNVVDGLQDAPNAIAEIAQQQCQLHELVVRHLREPMAANDIGCLSYRNPYPVLDLWGLASDRAREMRFAKTPGWMQTLMADEGVEIAMIYGVWFERALPMSWIRVARLRSESVGYAADIEVDLFATDEAAARRLRSALDDYEQTDHPGTTIIRS